MSRFHVYIVSDKLFDFNSKYINYTVYLYFNWLNNIQIKKDFGMNNGNYLEEMECLP